MAGPMIDIDTRVFGDYDPCGPRGEAHKFDYNCRVCDVKWSDEKSKSECFSCGSEIHVPPNVPYATIHKDSSAL